VRGGSSTGLSRSVTSSEKCYMQHISASKCNIFRFNPKPYMYAHNLIQEGLSILSYENSAYSDVVFRHPHNLRIESTMVRPPARCQQRHAAEFGLVVLSSDLHNRVDYVSMCEFCQSFAREARDGRRTILTVQHYRPPFRRAQFVDHVEGRHPAR
jgi:hypothetical protein